MNTWEANIRKVVPYTPGEQPNQPDMIKLNTNENPYPPAPGVEKALHGIQPDTLRLYPDPTAGDLVQCIVPDQNLGAAAAASLRPLELWNGPRHVHMESMRTRFLPQRKSTRRAGGGPSGMHGGRAPAGGPYLAPRKMIPYCTKTPPNLSSL